MMPTLYAAAWLLIYSGPFGLGPITAIPMPDMMFCMQEEQKLKVSPTKCIAGKDTRVTTP